MAHSKSKNGLLRHLEELEKEDLIAEIEKLCQKFEEVKKYFEIELSGDASKYVSAAKKKITAQFWFSNGNMRFNPKSSKLNNIIKEFEQVSIYKQDVIELYLFRIEETARWSGDNLGLPGPLQHSTWRAMKTVQLMIEAEGLTGVYAERTLRFELPEGD